MKKPPFLACPYIYGAIYLVVPKKIVDIVRDH